MATYKTEYEAVMDGMRGVELRDYEVMNDYSGQRNCVSLVDAMNSLSHMQRGEILYVVSCLPTGLDVLMGEQTAIDWAEDIHPDNMPTAYEVKRNARGYAVRLLYSTG